MPKVRKWFLVAVSLWLLLGAVIAVARFARGEGKFIYRARFTEFSVCKGPDPVTGLPQEPIERVSSSVETLYACGYLEADGSVPLYFMLFHEGGPTGWFDQVAQYQTGYVFKQLPERWVVTGRNRVEVFLQRRSLAAEDFVVLPEQSSDRGIGLYHMGARWYDPYLNQFLSWTLTDSSYGYPEDEEQQNQ